MCLNMLRYYGHSLIPLLSLAFTYETHPHSHPHPPELTHTLPLNDSQPYSDLILARPVWKNFALPVSFIMPQSCTLGLKNGGWVHWARCLLAVTAWWKQCDHMIRLQLSVYICAFVGHHLCTHACMDVVIAAYDVLKSFCGLGGGWVHVCIFLYIWTVCQGMRVNKPACVWTNRKLLMWCTREIICNWMGMKDMKATASI